MFSGYIMPRSSPVSEGQFFRKNHFHAKTDFIIGMLCYNRIIKFRFSNKEG